MSIMYSLSNAFLLIWVVRRKKKNELQNKEMAAI